jgi:hypothetical protein
MVGLPEGLADGALVGALHRKKSDSGAANRSICPCTVVTNRSKMTTGIFSSTFMLTD